MKTLHHASTVNTLEESINKGNIQKLFYTFNQKFKEDPNEDQSFTVNTGLDMVPALNPNEYNEAYSEASEQGWELSYFDDNYDTVTYKLKKK